MIFVGRNNQNEKQLQIQDEDKLKRTFSENGFFAVKNFYSRTGDIVDAFEYTLIATMNGQIQAACWADDSDDKPEGLAKVASV